MPSSDDPVRRVLDIMSQLRDPQSGCPWDIQQTFASIAPYTIEEACEVADAIARDDYAELKEELGDLLLQVVFHAQMAAEKGLFDFNDVAEVLAQKLVRRHPHVFGTENESSDIHRIGQRWEEIKREERAAKGQQRPSAMDGVPSGLPALSQALKLQKKSAKAGMDWPSWQPVRLKIDEELAELDEAVAANDDDAISDELGDVLFSLVNLSRHWRRDPELILRRASDKFQRRFRAMEQLADQDGIAIPDRTPEHVEQLWQRAKKTLS